MSAALNLSDAALALLRRRLSGEETEITDRNRGLSRACGGRGDDPLAHLCQGGRISLPLHRRGLGAAVRAHRFHPLSMARKISLAPKVI
jgi:hypothetical protein